MVLNLELIHCFTGKARYMFNLASLPKSQVLFSPHHGSL
jgi:hypothetical protein